jgi:hypothetical protein
MKLRELLVTHTERARELAMLEGRVDTLDIITRTASVISGSVLPSTSKLGAVAANKEPVNAHLLNGNHHQDCDLYVCETAGDLVLLIKPRFSSSPNSTQTV